MIVPMKAKDFSPFILGYLACWNAASITLVVFSFTDVYKHKDTSTHVLGDKQNHTHLSDWLLITSNAKTMEVSQGCENAVYYSHAPNGPKIERGAMDISHPLQTPIWSS